MRFRHEEANHEARIKNPESRIRNQALGSGGRQKSSRYSNVTPIVM